MRSWVEFWESEHALYVNDQHKGLNARLVARDFARCIPGPDAIVLDFGCGEALYAMEVKARCKRLILCDAAQNVREKLRSRVAGQPGIDVIAPEDIQALPDSSVDLVVVMSVIQYIDHEGLGQLLDLWRAKLKPGGKLILADVVPPGVSPLTDALALLRLAWQGAFFWAAIGGLIKTVLSNYGRVRKQLGFAMYQEGELNALLARHAYASRRIYPNFLHNQARMTFEASKPPQSNAT